MTPFVQGSGRRGYAEWLVACAADRCLHFNFFSPSVSGGIGWQWTTFSDYTYWNAGLALGFMENWSADIRYWDTDFSDAGCLGFSGFDNICDARVVGTVSATF
jgi:hypothetical protein